MKISGSSPANSRATSTPVAIPYRTGDVVVVQVQSAVSASGELQLKFPNGELLSSVLSSKFSGKEGDFLTVRVQGNNENKIYAEIVRSHESLRISNNHMAFLLSRINIANSSDNYMIASHMIKNGILLSEDNFKEFADYTKNFPEMPLEQIAFMIKNDVPFNEQNISVVESFILHKCIFGDEFLVLFGFIDFNDKKNDKLKSLLKEFYNNANEHSLNQIKNSVTIKNLIDILRYVESQMDFGEQAEKDFNSYIDKLKMQYEIIKKMQYVMSYLQIPISINGHFNVAEFCMLKQRKMRKTSVFLRVPTSNIGVLGFFLIIDDENKVECYISCKEESYARRIKNNIIMLYELLGSSGFRLAKVTYNQLPSDISPHNFQLYAELITEKKGFDERM